MGRFYDSSVATGRGIATIQYVAAILLCLFLVVVGGFIAFGKTKNQNEAGTKKSRLIAGGVFALLGLCCLCLAWTNRRATQTSRGYAAATSWVTAASAFV